SIPIGSLPNQTRRYLDTLVKGCQTEVASGQRRGAPPGPLMPLPATAVTTLLISNCPRAIRSLTSHLLRAGRYSPIRRVCLVLGPSLLSWWIAADRRIPHDRCQNRFVQPFAADSYLELNRVSDRIDE